MVRVDPFSPLGFLFLQNNRAVAADSAEIGFFFIFFFVSQAFLRITAEIGESNESVEKKGTMTRTHFPPVIGHMTIWSDIVSDLRGTSR